MPAAAVLLIEAGPDYGSDPANWPPELLNPLGVPTDSHSWGYEHSQSSLGHQLGLPRRTGGRGHLDHERLHLDTRIGRRL